MNAQAAVSPSLFVSLVICTVLCNYRFDSFGFYSSLVVTLAILAAGIWGRSAGFFRSLGLSKVPLMSLFISTIFFLLCAIRIFYLCDEKSISYLPVGELSLIFYLFFHACNEEIVFGLIPFVLLKRRWGLAFAVAVMSSVFALGHLAFYALNPFRIHSIFLCWTCLGSLFIFGLLRCFLYEIQQNIMITTLFHFSWNLLLIGGSFWQNGRELREAEVFNFILGDKVIIALLAGAFAFIFYRGKTFFAPKVNPH